MLFTPPSNPAEQSKPRNEHRISFRFRNRWNSGLDAKAEDINREVVSASGGIAVDEPKHCAGVAAGVPTGAEPLLRTVY